MPNKLKRDMYDIIDNYSFIKSPARLIGKTAILDLVSNLTCEQVKQHLNELTTNSRISFASSFLTSDGSSVVGNSGEFVVKLNDSSQIPQLQQLVNETNTAIIDKKPHYNKYTIKADKNSDGNVFDMANLFYLKEFTEYAEPNFIAIIPRSPPPY
jgi:hypothetical protein